MSSLAKCGPRSERIRLGVPKRPKCSKRQRHADSAVLSLQWNSSVHLENYDKHVCAVEEWTDEVDVENIEEYLACRRELMYVDRDAYRTHLLAARTVPYEQPDVVAHVRPRTAHET